MKDKKIVIETFRPIFMKFIKYQHVERFGNSEVEGIEKGGCYIFPKLDGSNGSIWLGDDGEVKAGSRNRELSLDNDNAGFYAWVLEQENIKEYLKENPNHILYGEWLVPHTIKSYKEDSWRNFYVFDVAVTRDKLHEGDDGLKYLHYEDYYTAFADRGIKMIPAIDFVIDFDYETVEKYKDHKYLLESGIHEGIVIKNYEYKNRYGRTTWAKVIFDEFKEEKESAKKIRDNSVEVNIVNHLITKSLVDKEYEKINAIDGWSSKDIPRLLETIFHCLITEDFYDALKKYKFPSVNFKILRVECNKKVKELKPELF